MNSNNKLFAGMRYYVIACSDKVALELLDRNGATKTTLLTSSCSLAISDDPDADEVAEAADLHNVKVVTPQWVSLSCKLQTQQQMDWFHPGIKKLFRGVTAFIAKVGRQDWFHLYALLSFRGAEIKCRLDNTVTHFVTTQGGGRLIDQLTQLKARVRIVLPDWVTDSVQHNAMQRESDYHPSRLNNRLSAATFFALTGSGSSSGNPGAPTAMLSFGPAAAAAAAAAASAGSGTPQPIDVHVGSHVDNVPVMSVNIQQRPAGAQQQTLQMQQTAAQQQQQQQQQVTILTHNQGMMRVQPQSVGAAAAVSHMGQPRFATAGAQQQQQPSQPLTPQQQQQQQQQQQPFQMRIASPLTQQPPQSPTFQRVPVATAGLAIGASVAKPQQQQQLLGNPPVLGLAPPCQQQMMMSPNATSVSMSMATSGSLVVSTGSVSATSAAGALTVAQQQQQQQQKKFKTHKHHQEQSLNEEEKDAIVQQNVKNILSHSQQYLTQTKDSGPRQSPSQPKKPPRSPKSPAKTRSPKSPKSKVGKIGSVPVSTVAPPPHSNSGNSVTVVASSIGTVVTAAASAAAAGNTPGVGAAMLLQQPQQQQQQQQLDVPPMSSTPGLQSPGCVSISVTGPAVASSSAALTAQQPAPTALTAQQVAPAQSIFLAPAPQHIEHQQQLQQHQHPQQQQQQQHLIYSHSGQAPAAAAQFTSYAQAPPPQSPQYAPTMQLQSRLLAAQPNMTLPAPQHHQQQHHHQQQMMAAAAAAAQAQQHQQQQQQQLVSPMPHQHPQQPQQQHHHQPQQTVHLNPPLQQLQQQQQQQQLQAQMSHMQSPVSVAVQQHQHHHQFQQQQQQQHPSHSGATVVVTSSAAAVAAAVAQQQQQQQQHQAAIMAAKHQQQLQPQQQQHHQHPQLPLHQQQHLHHQQHHPAPGVLIGPGPPSGAQMLKPPPSVIGVPPSGPMAHAHAQAQPHPQQLQQQQQPPQQQHQQPAHSQPHQQQHPPKPTYLGHNCPEKLPVDLCLLGCVFFVPAFGDCPKYRQHWLDRIESRGGVIARRYSPDRVTHVLLECLTCDEYFVALQDKKRIVSMNWLATCITKGVMEPPTEPQHLPCIVDRQNSPSYCRDQVFAIHGFTVDDRLKLYYMIKCLAARYSSVLCATVSVLVCKKGDTDVVNKARSMGITVVNAKFVIDLYRGNFAILAKPVPDKYSRWDATKSSELALTKGDSEALMAPWTTPVNVTADMLHTAVENRKTANSNDKKRKLEEANSDNLGSSIKRIKLESGAAAAATSRDPSAPDAAAPAYPVWQRPGTDPLLVSVSGLSKDDRAYCAQLCTKLGGRLLKDTEAEKSHILVTPALTVTPKLLLAISIGAPIVNADWLSESASAEAWLQPDPFVLVDREAERQLGIDLASVLESSRQRKLFGGYSFCLGPTCGGCGGAVKDDLIRKLINANGGHVVERLPSIEQCHEPSNPKHLFVGTEEDCHCVHYMLRGRHGRLGTQSETFVLDAALRQRIDFQSHQLQFKKSPFPIRPPVSPPPPPPPPQAPPTSQAAPTPPAVPAANEAPTSSEVKSTSEQQQPIKEEKLDASTSSTVTTNSTTEASSISKIVESASVPLSVSMDVDKALAASVAETATTTNSTSTATPADSSKPAASVAESSSEPSAPQQQQQHQDSSNSDEQVSLL